MSDKLVAIARLTEKDQLSRFELGVCMAVYGWEDLTVAVQNQWGGPDSADKRDWLSGSIVELFEQLETVEEEDIEERLLQVMQDEFEVSVEDDTAYNVAESIIKIYNMCLEKDFSLVDSLYQRFLNKRPSTAPVQVIEELEVLDSE
ncbi:Pre-rRNA-processing protein TSR2-domain-containing protein [Dipodascopsis uninucleata]